MGRKIIVFADGTGNSAAKPFKTNVWRLYQALDLLGGKQLASFADGVGTSGFKPFAILGLALGFGVRRRVLSLYRFLCLNFREGDEIYVFGFSRGAFIARILVGLVSREGLVTFRTQEELDRNALAAYREYRKKAFSNNLPWVKLLRLVRDGIDWGLDRLTGSEPYEAVKPTDGERAAANIRIRFLGLWDTVAAYGLPVDELTQAVNRFVWPLSFANHRLLPSVDYARQALSLDDERRTFFPIPFNESDELTSGEYPRLRQVWFAGSHSNVGGGYPDDSLSYLPLCWMIGEAAKAGLKFKPDVVATYWDQASENGRIYASRSNASLFYRYHPRQAEELMGRKLVPVEVPASGKVRADQKPFEVEMKPQGDQVKPLVDGSVFLRMARGNDGYASLALPRSVEVLSPGGNAVPFDVAQAVDHTPDEYILQGTDRLDLPATRRRDIRKGNLKLHSVLNELRGRDAEQHESLLCQTWETVWWQRVLYFVLLFSVLTVLLFPMLAGYLTTDNRFDLPAESSAGVQDGVNDAWRGLVGPVAGMFESFLPSFVKPWFDAITNNGALAFVLSCVLGGTLLLSKHLHNRIRDRAIAAWSDNVAKRTAVSARNRRKVNRRTTLMAALGAFVLAGLALIFGSDGARSTNHAGAIFFAIVGCIFVGSSLWMALVQPKQQDAVKRSPFLCIAGTIRKSAFAEQAYCLAKTYVVPGLFLLASAYLALAVANKLSQQVMAATGVVCPYSDGDKAGKDQKLTPDGLFRVDDPCWNSGIRLDAGVTYLIKLNIVEPWFDAKEQTDVRGFLAGEDSTSKEDVKSKSFYRVGNLFKRWWGQPWFKPIIRIGRRGNEEYALEQLQPQRMRPPGSNTLFALVKPERSGALYIYVNDAAIGIPGLHDLFYREENRGLATVEVKRVDLEAFDK